MGASVRLYGSVGQQWGTVVSRWRPSIGAVTALPRAGEERQSVTLFEEQRRSLFGWAKKAEKETEEESKEEVNEEVNEEDKSAMAEEEDESVNSGGEESEGEGEGEGESSPGVNETTKKKRVRDRDSFEALYAYYENHAIGQHFRHPPRGSLFERMVPLTETKEDFDRLEHVLLTLVKYVHKWSASETSAYVKACVRFDSYDAAVALIRNKAAQFYPLTLGAYMKLLTHLNMTGKNQDALTVAHRAIEQGHPEHVIGRQEVSSLYSLERFTDAIKRASDIVAMEKLDRKKDPAMVRLAMQAAAITADQSAFESFNKVTQEFFPEKQRTAAARALMAFVRNEDDTATAAAKESVWALRVLQHMASQQLAISKGENPRVQAQCLEGIDVEAIFAKVQALATPAEEPQAEETEAQVDADEAAATEKSEK